MNRHACGLTPLVVADPKPGDVDLTYHQNTPPERRKAKKPAGIEPAGIKPAGIKPAGKRPAAKS